MLAATSSGCQLWITDEEHERRTALDTGCSDEICDGADNDCDGAIDEGMTSGPWYPDADGDGFGGGVAVDDCELPSGYVADDGDCDDEDPAINPDALEICGDAIDQDCDGDAAESCALEGYLSIADKDAMFYGPIADSAMGHDLASVGDVNGDGAGDVLLSVQRFDSALDTSVSDLRLFLGPRSGDVEAVSADLIIDESFLGVRPVGLGDGDGDGFDDVLVGIDDGEIGMAMLLRGGESQLWDSPTRIIGGEVGMALGADVDRLDDWDGDGLPDFVIGAPAFDGRGAGYVVSGALVAGDQAIVDNYALRVVGESEGAELAAEVAWIPDTDGDGLGELAMSGLDGSGQPWFFFFEGLADGGSLAPADSVAILGADEADIRFGAAIAGVEDMNGDGFGDLAVGAPDSERQQGSIYLFYGPFDETFSEASADIVIIGDQSELELGTSVASAGDVDGDGLNEIVAGAPGLSFDGEVAGGGSFLFEGVIEGDGTSYESSLAATAVFYMDAPDGELGAQVGAGDVDLDGYSDLLLGAPGYSGDVENIGAVFLLLGGPASE